MAVNSVLPYCDDLVTNNFTYPALYNTTCQYGNYNFSSAREACLSPVLLFSDYAIMDDCETSFTGAYNDSSRCDKDFVQRVLDLTNGCLEQYCESPDPNLGGCPYTPLTISQFSCDNDANGPIDMLMAFSCDNVVKTVNSDIGGVGVFIAYIMQLVLVMITAICFLALGPLRDHTLALILRLAKIFRRKWYAARKDEIRSRVDNYLQLRLAMFKTVAVDLQETQCFFMMASQIAASIALGQENKVLELSQSSFLGATNYYQLENNYVLLTLIGTCGILPIGLTNYILILGDNWSWYIAIISLVTIGTSLYTYVTPGHVLWELQPNTSGATPDVSYVNATQLDKCGYNPPPLMYCLPPAISSYRVALGVLSILFAIIQGFLSALIMWHSRHPAHQHLGLSKRLKLRPRLIKLVLLFGFICFFAPMCLALYMFSLLQRSGAIDTHDWSIGQIISIWTLLPVIVKYLYGIFAGVSGHFRVRVPSPYEVINTECIAAEVNMASKTFNESEQRSSGDVDRSSLHPGYGTNHESWFPYVTERY